MEWCSTGNMRGLLLGLSIVIGTVGRADTSSWSLTGDGIWTNPACWTGGNVPGALTNDVSINAEGTYTSHWDTILQPCQIGALTIGSVTAGGQQTMLLSGYGYTNAWVLGDLNVGTHGVYEQQQLLCSFPTNAVRYLNIASGGVFRMSSLDDRTWGTGKNRILTVAAGGVVSILDGSGLQITVSEPGPNNFSTNNGTITGAGKLQAGSGGTKLCLAGTGLVDGPGVCEVPSNGRVVLGGSLTFNRDIVPAGAQLGPLLLAAGANLTLNGNIVWTNVGSAYYADSDTATTVMGRGNIDIQFNTSPSYFGGPSYTTQGSHTLGGAGQLILRSSGNRVDLHFTQFTLARSAFLNDNGGSFYVIKGCSMVITSSTGCLTLASGTTLHVARDVTYGSYSYVRIRGGGALNLSGAGVEGNASGDPYALHLSDDGSGATLALTAGTTNTFAGVQTNQTLSLRLGTNAVVSAGAASALLLHDAVLHVAMTNPAQWGWSSQGTLIIGSNVQMEALSTDHGKHVEINSEPFMVARLAFTAPNSTLVLANSAGGSRRALYVKTLDLSALPGGTLDLQGMAGAERVYYANLINPNGVSFVTPSEWIQIPQSASLLLVN